MSDDDFVQIVMGKLNSQQVCRQRPNASPVRPQLNDVKLIFNPKTLAHHFKTQAFLRGRLKVKGNMGLAMKLEPVLKLAKKKANL